LTSPKEKASGVIELMFAIVFGIIFMEALYPVNRFMAIVGIIFVLALGIKGIYDILSG
jgi:hypothetical protein